MAASLQDPAYTCNVQEFLHFVSNLPLSAVTFGDVQALEQALVDRGLLPRSVNRKLHALRSPSKTLGASSSLVASNPAPA